MRTPIGESNNSVVLEAEDFGSIGNRRRTLWRHSRDSQQKLVLLRMQAGIAGRFLTDQQELPHLMAKGRKGLMKEMIWILRHCSFGRTLVLSYCDI